MKAKSIWTRCLDLIFGTTPAEEERMRAAAGKPWRTAYYVAGRDWPVPDPGGITLGEAYAAVAQMAAQAGDGKAVDGA